MCTVSQSTGLTLYLHYEPVGINNWSVVLGVSEAEALAGTRGVVETLSMMAIIVTALLLSYLSYMLRQYRGRCVRRGNLPARRGAEAA